MDTKKAKKKKKKKNPENKIQLYIVTINTNWLKVKVWGKINLPGSIKRICLLSIDKANFRARKFIRDKLGCWIMIKRSICRAAKCVRQKLQEVHHTIIFGDFSEMDRSSRTSVRPSLNSTPPINWI